MSVLKTPILTALAGGLLLLGVHAALAAGGSNTQFLKKAIRGDAGEIKIGELAEQKSTDQSVKRFGQMLVTDHTQLHLPSE